MTQCQTCGAGLKPGVTRCMKCGSMLPQQQPPPQQQQQGAPAQQQYIQQPQVVYVQQPQVIQCSKSKVTAGLLGIFLGAFGVHKFYLGRIGYGIVYVLFFWTYIPAILGLIEGITYLTMSEDAFCRKYGQK